VRATIRCRDLLFPYPAMRPPLLQVSNVTLEHRTDERTLTAVEDVTDRCILLGPTSLRQMI